MYREYYSAAYYFKVVSAANSRKVPIKPQEIGNYPTPLAIPSTQDYHLGEKLSTKNPLSLKERVYKLISQMVFIKHSLPLELIVHWSSKSVLALQMIKT